MTKLLKIDDKKPTKISRELISKFGEELYHSNEVKSVKILVKFKDGISIAFERSEESDGMEIFEKKVEEEIFNED